MGKPVLHPAKEVRVFWKLVVGEVVCAMNGSFRYGKNFSGGAVYDAREDGDNRFGSHFEGSGRSSDFVTVIHLQMLGLWWEEALEAEALAPVVVKGAWLNYQIELPMLVLAAAAAFCGRRFQLLLETELSRRGEPRKGQGSHRLQHLLPQQNTVPVARPLQTRHVLGTSRVSQLFL